MICAREAGELDAAGQELSALASDGQSVRWRATDVTEEPAVGATVKQAILELGGLHVLVNNAGVYGPFGPIEDSDWRDWVRAVEINLFGSVLPIRAVLPHFKAQGHGKIIQLSGGGATNPLPRISAYAASKAAMARLTETVAEECKSYRIDVNAIAPGSLNTRLLDEVLAAGPEKVGADFYARAVRQKQDGGVRSNAMPRSWRCSWPRRERRHHRQAYQRLVGPLGTLARPSRGTGGKRCVHAAAHHRPRSRVLLGRQMTETPLRSRDRRLRLVGQRRARTMRGTRGSLRAPMWTAGKRRHSPLRPRDAMHSRTGGRCSIASSCDIVWLPRPMTCSPRSRRCRCERPSCAGREARPGGVHRRRRADPGGRAAADVKVRVGFNHRYHRALRKARELVDAGALGELMFVRGRYGHGGRIGYEREWRADPGRPAAASSSIKDRI